MRGIEFMNGDDPAPYSTRAIAPKAHAIQRYARAAWHPDALRTQATHENHAIHSHCRPARHGARSARSRPAAKDLEDAMGAEGLKAVKSKDLDMLYTRRTPRSPDTRR